MAMTQCEDCGKPVSDQAQMCVHCGCPIADTEKQDCENAGATSSAWQAAMRAKTPINIFAIAIMCCSAILGMSAAGVDSENSLIAFTYTLHTFLAVTGMFFVTLLFCRKGIYHPDDLAKAQRDGVKDLGQDRPILAVILIVLMMIGYGLYQAVSAGMIEL